MAISFFASSYYERCVRSCYILSRSYIKRFVWYNLYVLQSVLRFSLLLHYCTGCSYRFITFVHKVYAIFRSLNAMIEKEAAVAIIIALGFFKKRKKANQGKKEKSGWNLGLKDSKAWEYMKLCWQNCGRKMNATAILWMTSENFEEIFQLTKDDTREENTKMMEPILPRLKLAATIRFLSTVELYKRLQFQFRIHNSILSLFVLEVCQAIFNRLKGKYIR